MNNIKRQALLSLLIVAAFGQEVTAAALQKKRTEPETGFAVYPQAGGYFFSSAQRYEPAPLAGIRLSYNYLLNNPRDSIILEATGSYFRTAAKGSSGPVDGYILRADALYPFRFDRLTPYVAVGAGLQFISEQSGNDKSPLVNYGIGVNYRFRNDFAVRLDLRHLLVFEGGSGRNNFETTAGITYMLGMQQSPAKTVPTPAPDADGDGVPDSADKCPGTQKGLIVDRDGCPKSGDIKLPAAAPSSDTQPDGNEPKRKDDSEKTKPSGSR